MGIDVVPAGAQVKICMEHGTYLPQIIAKNFAS
jgi:hypothetical protein